VRPLPSELLYSWLGNGWVVEVMILATHEGLIRPAPLALWTSAAWAATNGVAIEVPLQVAYRSIGKGPYISLPGAATVIQAP
jgi:hypothetical protein